MNFMKLSAAASAILAAVAFTACDDSSSADDKSYDCTVKGGVKVLYPEGGESFKLGETITVIFGSDVEDSGYRFLLKTSEKDLGLDLLDSSVTVPNPDGKKCFEQKVVLSEDALPMMWNCRSREPLSASLRISRLRRLLILEPLS